MPTRTPAAERLIDSHEERIRQLEALSRDTAMHIGIFGERIETLAEEIKSGVAEVGQKIIDCTRPLAETLEERGQTIDRNIGQIRVLEEHRARVLEEEKSLKDRHEILTKGLWALVFTGVGALLKELVSVIARLF